MSSQGRQPSSLQQNNQPKEPPKIPSISSPASLLWAHQLHREQNALSAQISELETSLKSSITTINESILLKLDAFTGQLDHLRSEIEQLRRDGVTEPDKMARSLENNLTEKLDGVNERLRVGFEREHEMTSEMIRAELGRFKDEITDIVKAMYAEPKQQASDTPGPRYRVPPPASLDDSRPQIAQEGQPASKPLFLVETQPVIVWQDNVHSLSTHCDIPLERTSIHPTTHPTDIETMEHGNNSIQTITKVNQLNPPELIMQGSIPLPNFIELGPKYIGQGHTESRVVKALWKGLNDLELRRLVAKEMPDSFARWTCTEFCNVVRKLDGQKVGMDKDAMVRPVEGRRKKRRRVISVVWPEENEEEG